MGNVDNAGLTGEGVHKQRADLLSLNGLDDGVDVHQLAAGIVDQHHAVLHLGKGLAVDHAGGLRQQRGMNGDDVGLTVQGVQIHILGILADGVVFIHVVGQNPAAKAGQALDDGVADLAGTHDAHGHGAQLTAHLALQGKIVIVGIVQGLLELADAHENGHDGILRHAVGRICAVAQAEAQRTGIVTVHVVIAHAAAGQHLNAVALQLIQHLVAVIGLAQSGDAVAAHSHVGGGLIQIGGGGDQLNAVLLAHALNNRLFVGTYFVSSDFHNSSPYSCGAVRRSSTADGTQCFHTFPSVRSSWDGDFPLIAQSFRAGSMAAASPAAIIAATCSSV